MFSVCLDSKEVLQQQTYFAPVIPKNTTLFGYTFQLGVPLYQTESEFFLWSLLPLNLYIEVEYLWSHLEWRRFHFRFRSNKNSPIRGWGGLSKISNKMSKMSIIELYQLGQDLFWF